MTVRSTEAARFSRGGRYLRRLFLAVCAFLYVVDNINAEERAPAAGSESLGGQLLEDLPGSTRPKPVPANEQQPDHLQDRQPNPAVAPPLRFDDVGQDDKGAAPSGPMRLVRAGRGMVEAETLLGKQSTVSQAGQTQKQVVAQLDALIAELSKQCNGNCNSSANKPPSPSQRSQAKPGKSGSKPGRGAAPARDSNADLTGTANKAASDKAELDSLVKHLWGHLPERQREQMMQSFSDEFLPKYEAEIEQYYQRLSEEPPAGSR